MLSLEGRIIIFKTLVISKIVYLDRRTSKNPKDIYMALLTSKISHKTLYNNFENGGLKHIDISSKSISLQCSWLRKLCDKNFQQWKIIPSHLINKYFRK